MVAATLFALSGLHVYWAAGGSAGLRAAIPEFHGAPIFQPSPMAALVVATALLTAGLIVGSRAWMLVDHPLLRYAVWALVLVFALRAMGDFRWVGFMKRHRGTEFARLDDVLYSPLCLLLAAGCLAVALNKIKPVKTPACHPCMAPRQE